MYAGETRRAPVATRATAPLKVFLLGRFEVVRPEGPIPFEAWRRRRPADLLKLVALTPGRSACRDDVIRRLWGGEASGASNLHRALYDLRQILGGRWVDLDHGRVFLSDEVWIDVDAFELSAASTDPAELAAAATLYRGDLCPDDHEATWLTDRRERLREVVSATAVPLARAAMDRGDRSAALSLLRQVVAIHPEAEEPTAWLMRLLGIDGRRADALRLFEAYEAALRARGLPPPGAELCALRGDIQHGRVGPVRAGIAVDGYRRAARRLLGTSEPPPLRGRTAPLAVLESLVARGWGSLVLLGERGVGTTRLAVEGARIAQEAGATVLSGTFDAGPGLPYACFCEVFAEHARAGGTVRDPFSIPVVGARHANESARLLEATRSALVEIGGGRPVYVIVEDLHHADDSSANLLHFLARHASTIGLMLVATCREDALHAGTPAQTLLSHLDCERLARGIRVQRLDLAGSRAQLADLLGTDPGAPLAQRFYRLTDGNPFHLEELARAFKDAGHLSLPEDLVATVRERVSRLGPRAVALLEAGAVMGRRFDLEALLPATGLTAHDTLLALDEALQARLVVDAGDGQRFQHALVRDAIEGGLRPDRREALHRAIANAVEDRAARTSRGIEDAALQLAHHHEAGKQPKRAFPHHVAAGQQAWHRGGLREACASFEAASALADVAGVSGPERLELLDALGRVQLTLAEIPAALRTFETALSLEDASGWYTGPELRARARRRTALALLVVGRWSDARIVLERGLADALLGTGEERAEILHLIDAMDTIEGRRVARGVPTSPPLEGLSTELQLALWQYQLLGTRSPSELAAAIVALRERASARCWTAGLAVAGALDGALCAREGRLDAGDRALRDAQQRFAEQGCAFGEAHTLELRARILTATGQVDDALTLLGEGLVLAGRAELRCHALLGIHAALARNRLAARALHAAEDAIAEASAVASRHGECAVCRSVFLPEAVSVLRACGRHDDADELFARATAVLGPTTSGDA